MQFLHTCVNLNIMSQATLSLQATHSWHHGVLYLLVSLVQAEGHVREGPEAISGRCLEAPQLSRNNCAASESFLRASAFPFIKWRTVGRRRRKAHAAGGQEDGIANVDLISGLGAAATHTGSVASDEVFLSLNLSLFAC